MLSQFFLPGLNLTYFANEAYQPDHAFTTPVFGPPSLPSPLQFFRLGSLKPHDPNEAYQPDTRLRLGLGIKASGVGGKTYSAGGRPLGSWAAAACARPKLKAAIKACSAAPLCCACYVAMPPRLLHTMCAAASHNGCCCL